MSWILRLYDTYENNLDQVGKISGEKDPVLLPICHSTQQAHITVTIGLQGEFLRANVVDPDDRLTIIPVTEKSASRAGRKPTHHPLCDKLQYLAPDFSVYSGNVTSGYRKDPLEPHRNYVEDLRKWCSSSYAVPQVKAVLRYVEGGTVLRDLVGEGVLPVNQAGTKLLEQWPREAEGDPPPIFSIIQNTMQPADAFVRWAVEIPGDPQTDLWKNSNVYDSWIKYYISCQSKTGLCYATGENAKLALLHPAKLLNEGDKAKIISANDTSGFTFRGRFSAGDQAAGLSFEVTQKAHNALRWLIRRQAFLSGDLAILTWSPGGESVPDPLMDTIALGEVASSGMTKRSDPAYTGEDFARQLRQAILSFRKDLSGSNGIMIMALDSATQGRMSIRLYREFVPQEFLNRLEFWHRTAAWVHRFKSRSWEWSNGDRHFVEYTAAPSPIDIADTIYGKRLDDSLRKKAIERLVRCIIEGERLPTDMVETAVKRACTPLSMETWEWQRALSIACAMYRKSREKEEFSVALDENRKTRDYLFGRLLALADSIEEWALSETGEQRPTNAVRLMQRFSERPFTTWSVIELGLAPYKARLGSKAKRRIDMIAQVMELFDPDEFTSDERLSGEFLLGYHCQKRALWTKETNSSDQKEDVI